MGIFSTLFGGRKDPEDDKPLAQVESVETSDNDDMPENVSLLDDQHVEQFTQWAGHAPDFLSDHNVDLTDDELGCYDEAFKRWHQSGDVEDERDMVISCLGSYFGDKLIRDFDMRWVTVDDQDGQAFGVRHTEVEVMLFPFDSVIKRIESGDYGFMSAIYLSVETRLNEGGIASRERL